MLLKVIVQWLYHLETLYGLLPVPLNGHWGRWAAWSACSQTCGKAYQTRSRLCNDPPPQFNGNICEGVLVQVQMCKGNRPKCKSSSKVTNSGELSVAVCTILNREFLRTHWSSAMKNSSQIICITPLSLLPLARAKIGLKIHCKEIQCWTDWLELSGSS